jgi:hypothetical protein
VATPTVREVLSGSQSGTGTITINTGAGTSIGDVLVCFYGANFYTVGDMGTPSGTSGTWTLQATGDQGSNEAHLKLFTRTVTAGGSQTVTVPPAIDCETFAIVYVIAGASSEQDGAAGNQGAASTSHIAPSVSPVGSDDLLLCGAQAGPATTVTFTYPGSMTNGLTENAAGSAGMGSARQNLSSSGATGTRTFTCSASRTFATASIALAGGSSGTPLIGFDPHPTHPGASPVPRLSRFLESPKAYTASSQSTSASAENAPFTIAGQDATTAILVNAECATFVLAAQDPNTSIAVSAIDAAIGMTISDPADSIRASSDIAPFTFDAQNVTATVAAVSELVSWTLAAIDATLTVAPVVENAPITFTANDATVSVNGSVNVLAEVALISMTANDASPGLGVAAQAITLGFSALDLSALVQLASDIAVVTFTANDASVGQLSGSMNPTDRVLTTMDIASRTLPEMNPADRTGSTMKGT